MTCPHHAPQPDLAPEAESLREAWLAFGQVLEAARPATPSPLAGLKPPPSPRRWLLVASAALAVSLMIAVGLQWMNARRPAGGGIAPSRPIASTDAERSPRHAKVEPTAAGNLRWEDSLDRQIDAAGDDVAFAQSELAHTFDAADLVRYRLQQAQQDLEESKP